MIRSRSVNIGHTIAIIYQDLTDDLTPSDKKGEGCLEGIQMEEYLHDIGPAPKYARNT